MEPLHYRRVLCRSCYIPLTQNWLCLGSSTQFGTVLSIFTKHKLVQNPKSFPWKSKWACRTLQVVELHVPPSVMTSLIIMVPVKTDSMKVPRTSSRSWTYLMENGPEKDSKLNLDKRLYLEPLFKSVCSYVCVRV